MEELVMVMMVVVGRLCGERKIVIGKGRSWIRSLSVWVDRSDDAGTGLGFSDGFVIFVVVVVVGGWDGADGGGLFVVFFTWEGSRAGGSWML